MHSLSVRGQVTAWPRDWPLTVEVGSWDRAPPLRPRTPSPGKRRQRGSDWQVASWRRGHRLLVGAGDAPPSPTGAGDPPPPHTGSKRLEQGGGQASSSDHLTHRAGRARGASSRGVPSGWFRAPQDFQALTVPPGFSGECRI